MSAAVIAGGSAAAAVAAAGDHGGNLHHKLVLRDPAAHMYTLHLSHLSSSETSCCIAASCAVQCGEVQLVCFRLRGHIQGGDCPIIANAATPRQRTKSEGDISLMQREWRGVRRCFKGKCGA